MWVLLYKRKLDKTVSYMTQMTYNKIVIQLISICIHTYMLYIVFFSLLTEVLTCTRVTTTRSDKVLITPYQSNSLFLKHNVEANSIGVTTSESESKWFLSTYLKQKCSHFKLICFNLLIMSRQASLIRKHFPKRPSTAMLHSLSKLCDVLVVL